MCTVFLKNAQIVHTEQCINVYLIVTKFKKADRCKCCMLLVLLTDNNNNNNNNNNK